MDGDTLVMPRYCSPSTIHTEQYIIMSKFSKVMSDYIRSLENISFRHWFTDTTYVILNTVLIVCQCAFILAVCAHIAREKKMHYRCIVHTIRKPNWSLSSTTVRKYRQRWNLKTPQLFKLFLSTTSLCSNRSINDTTFLKYCTYCYRMMVNILCIDTDFVTWNSIIISARDESSELNCED